MKEHRFFVSAEQLVGDHVIFTAAQWHQLHDVLRLRPGDRVRVFDGRERLDRVVELETAASGRLTETGRAAIGRVVECLAQPAEPRTRLVVYPALLQRDSFEPILQKLTEIGAATIAPLLTTRGVVRAAPDERRLARWQAIVREAAEQCGRGVVPELLPALPFAPAVERALAEGTVLVAYEGERHRNVRDALRDVQPTVALFIGPEGGFAPEEVAGARDAGALLVTLGPRILRSETASPLLAALVLHELGDLSSSLR